MKTLPWISFRQVGGLIILVWLIVIVVTILEACGIQVPGWTYDSGDHHTTAVSAVIWQPALPKTQTRTVLPISHGVNHPMTALLSTSRFVGSRRSPAAMVTEISGITIDGIHLFVEDDGRYLLMHNGDILSYSDLGDAYTSLAVAPWCGPHDHVTIVNHSIRSCSDLSQIFTGDLSDASDVDYISISGRYGIHTSDRHIHKLAWSPEHTFHTEQLIPIPQVLEGVVSIAKNEVLIAVLAPNGLIGLWTTDHLEIPSRGIRKLPNRSDVIWKSIHPAGGNSFIVFGEFRASAMHEAWFVSDVLTLENLKKFGEHH
jgi:hypothetical protein